MDMSVFNEAGFLIYPDEWSEIMMHEIANREGIKMNQEMVNLVLSCREVYEKEGAVPPLRVFSKIHGGDRKGTHLNKLFNGGPMKKIAMLGGLPQPTGCV